MICISMIISQVIDVFILIQQMHLQLDNTSKFNIDTKFSIKYHLIFRATLFRQWRWQSSSYICNISQYSTSDKAICSCFISNGTFAITSDMFDPDVCLNLLPFFPLNYIYIFFCLKSSGVH